MTFVHRGVLVGLGLGWLLAAAPAHADGAAAEGWALPPTAAPGDAYNATVAAAGAALGEARRFSDAFALVSERLAPSVVEVESSFPAEGRESGQSFARGEASGVVVSPDGLVLTADHALEQAARVDVRLRDGRSLPARVVGRDPATDLALLKVDAGHPLTAARFVEGDGGRVGEWVLAVGAPRSGSPVVTMGILSAKTRTGTPSASGGMGSDVLLTDALMALGSSGGALCDLEGRVLGVTTTSPGRGGMTVVVPAHVAKHVAEQLLKAGRVARPWGGVGVSDLSAPLAASLKVSPGAGVLVNEVAEGGPAQKANLRPGDIVAAIDGKPVKDAAQVSRELGERTAGQVVPLEILRDGRRYATSLTLAPLPGAAAPAPAAAAPRDTSGGGLGVTLRELTASEAKAMGLPEKRYTTLSSVAAGSLAERAGLREGDVLLDVDGVTEPTPSQVQKAWADGELLARVRRASGGYFAVVRR